MAIRDWRAEYSRGIALLRKPRYLLGGLAVAAAIAVVVVFLVLRGGQNQAPVSASEEPCSMESGGQRTGYFKTILLCSMDSPKCNPDQTQVFRAQPAGNWSTQALLIPDIPDGYLITGGDVVDPSIYRITSSGFNRIQITNYSNSSDYCTRHYWYYVSANRVSTDPEDRIRIRVCIYYDKWQGPPAPASCPRPAINASQ